ncbi:helix-turn-helix transcriptional regulator [Oceanobacillus rekensis]|uniref:helix-turn-helix transcriptional regulator n=1 Tax=Oceanobacillus rekensis TaxID=937927 RepID=UPI000B4500CA|nr:AraC family transcriptional regulator [Oceanobacillus rekensis]
MEVNNSSTNQRIEQGHQIRETFLQAIITCDTNEIDYYKQEILKVLKDDTMNIFKRVPGNMLRSYKNFLLSHNTLYSYSAEKGGLGAAKSHFISEKYAIMIEHTDQISKLDTIHLNMIDEYGDPSIRYDKLTNPSIADKAIHYIETNFAEEFLIEEMAHDLHVHPSHLMRSFKKEKGATISHARNQKRVKEAKELLIHSNLSMTEIAIMVGFNNSQYFSKIFRKEEGVTPKSFRKAHLNRMEE